MENKITIYKVYNELINMKKDMQNQSTIDRLNKFRAVDYREHILLPRTDYVKLWKYNGAYYPQSLLAPLYEMVVAKGYSKCIRTFRSMLKNEDRQKEMWIWGIQLVYADFIPRLNYYITCDGNLLTKNSLTIIKGHNPYNSDIMLTVSGERIRANRANIMFSHFIDDNSDGLDKLFFIDGFYGNCGADNVEKRA